MINKLIASCNIRVFSIDHQGFTGCYSKDYIQVWQGVKFQHCAEDWLLLQLSSKSIIDTLYALVGLKIINSQEFNGAAKEISKRDGKVMFSDIGGRCSCKSIGSVIEYIKNNDLKYPL